MIERNEEYGGTVKFSTYEELEEAYVKEEVYPTDLKNGVIHHLIKVRSLPCCIVALRSYVH